MGEMNVNEQVCEQPKERTTKQANECKKEEEEEGKNPANNTLNEIVRLQSCILKKSKRAANISSTKAI